MLDFSRLSAGSISTECIARLATEQGIHHSVWKQAPRSPWIHIQGKWEDYLHSRGSGFRKSLRRKLRQLHSLGEVSLETVTGRQALSEGLADGLRIEADGWKGCNKTAISSQHEVSSFYIALAQIMAAKGQLRLHFLTVDKVRIAFDYSILANRCLYSLKAGHSRAYDRFSPGTLLLALILQSAHEEQLVGMDLLADADPFKMHWTDTTRTHQWLHCYSDSLRGRFWQSIKCRISPALRSAWSRIRADQRLA